MLGQRLRRWPSIDPAQGQCLVFTGMKSELGHTLDSALAYCRKRGEALVDHWARV